MSTKRLGKGLGALIRSNEIEEKKTKNEDIKGEKSAISNILLKHVKPNPNKNETGGIVEKEMPLHISNISFYDPELKKGKIFVFSNHMDPIPMNIRVNGEVRKIKHTETQIFDLKDGQNSVKNLGRVSTGESSNCDKQPYTFNTEMFPEVETYYFVIQQGFDSTIRTFTCFKDFEVNEKAFLKQINNPRNGGSEFLQDLSKSFINSLIF